MRFRSSAPPLRGTTAMCRSPRMRGLPTLPGAGAEMTRLPDPFTAVAPTADPVPADGPVQDPAGDRATGIDGLDAAISDVERQFGLLVISARRSIRNRAADIHP